MLHVPGDREFVTHCRASLHGPRTCTCLLELRRRRGRRSCSVALWPAANGWCPTDLVTFKHAYSGRNITVPLTLRPDTPRMSVSRDMVSYNYGSERVEVQFLKDGSVDVVYSNGLVRRI